MTGKRFWIAHVRGANFKLLREKGFITFYPSLDDYVFLEQSDEHAKFLRKQIELGLAFVRGKEGYSTVSEEDVKRMSGVIEDKIGVGARILVVEGFGTSLEGEVLAVGEDGRSLICELKGWNRNYRVKIDRQDVVENPNEDLTNSP